MKYKSIDIFNTYTVRIYNERGPITTYIMNMLKLNN